MKKLWAVLALMFVFTGCSSVSSKDNIINLLTAPKLSRRENRVVAALGEYLGETVTLKYSKQGNAVQPVQLYDINNDGKDEAVVFYNNASSGAYVYMALMTNDMDGWHVVHTSEGNGAEVYGITFAQLEKSKPARIIVAYSYGDSGEKVLSVCHTDKGDIQDIQVYTCQAYAVADVTGDRVKDIITAGQTDDNEYTHLQIISSHNTQVLQPVAVRSMSRQNAKITNISVGKNDFYSTPAIVVDFTDINQFVHTECFSFMAQDGEENAIVSIVDPDTVIKKWNFGYNLTSADVDGDGYVETSTIIDYPYCYAKDIRVMEWTSFTSFEPIRKFFGLCLATNGVYMALPEDWLNYMAINSDGKSQWNVSNTVDDSDIFSFEFVSTKNSGDDYKSEIRYVNIGTLLLKLTFAENVSDEQKTFIADNIFYIK